MTAEQAQAPDGAAVNRRIQYALGYRVVRVENHWRLVHPDGIGFAHFNSKSEAWSRAPDFWNSTDASMDALPVAVDIRLHEYYGVIICDLLGSLPFDSRHTGEWIKTAEHALLEARQHALALALLDYLEAQP